MAHYSCHNVKWNRNMSRFQISNILAGIIRVLMERCDMKVYSVLDGFHERISENEELVRVCDLVKEVVEKE